MSRVEELWGDVGDRWRERLELMAPYIPAGASVLDLGAGAQGLRELVDGSYTPADVVARSSDTLPFDMATNTFPVGHWDVVVAAGVLEHSIRPEATVKAMRRLGRMAIVSYQPCPRQREIPKERIANEWVCHLTRRQMERLFRQSRFHVERIANWHRQLIYRLT